VQFVFTSVTFSSLISYYSKCIFSTAVFPWLR
jgi:hypothetical protein